MFYIEISLMIIGFLTICLFFLWIKNRRKRIKLKQLESINDPYEFEIFVEEILKDLGYKVIRTRKSRDFGADILLKKGRKKTVIQVKFWKNKLNEEVLKEVIASSYVYGAREGIVITSSRFSENIKNLSEELSGKGHLDRIILIDCEGLRSIVEGRRLL